MILEESIEGAVGEPPRMIGHSRMSGAGKVSQGGRGVRIKTTRSISRGGLTKKTPSRGGGFEEHYRQRPTLPGTLVPSTIGAEGLDDRVRNGNGYNPFAVATGKLAWQMVFPVRAAMSSVTQTMRRV